MTAPTYAARKSVYAKQWASMVIQVPGPVERAAEKLLKSKARYEAVGRAVGCPWFFIACIHWREASGNFAGVLHNGEKIIGTGKTTRLVPKGRGPFASWEDAAIDALSIAPHDMRKVNMDCVERFAYEAEKYNGWGYFNHGVPSAYLWSYSSAYKGGKYVADGVWDAHATDAQIGVMSLLKELMEQDPSISFASPTSYVPPDVAVGLPSAPVAAEPWWLVVIKAVMRVFGK